MNVSKRNGKVVPFDKNKIEKAILKAMVNGSGIVDEAEAEVIANEIEKFYEAVEKYSEKDVIISIYDIEALVVDKLFDHGYGETGRAYERYRAIREYQRERNTTDSGILGLLDATNEEVMNENSNKDAMLISTQRDLIAGEVSKDITKRYILPPHLTQAHEDGIFHFHDLDYSAFPEHNCDLVNIKDMLDNGTVINKRLIESPKWFQVACTVMTQIMAQVASSQFGGQSIAIKHLGKYLKRSEDQYYKMLSGIITSVDELNKSVEVLLQKELESGVQTIQYQINTLMTTNGAL